MLPFTRVSFVAATFSVLVAIGSVRNAEAQTDTLDTSAYILSDASNYETGCFGPCDCAVQTDALRGTFRLTLRSIDPLFRNYSVDDVDWVYASPSGSVTMRGRGTYRIGGEVALTHQLTVDLVVDGSFSQHFDSGLVLGGGDFPAITIRMPSHAYACHDSVIDLRAKPATAGVVPDDAAHTVRARPNPFRGGTQLEITLDASGPLEVAVLDGQGRRVRMLRSGGWEPAGTFSMAWDGRLDSGGLARPGLYFVSVHTADHEWLRRVVKLD